MLQETSRISQDVHVEPFWKRCDMCNLNYNIIGKMETFTKDSNYILENTGMNASKINVEEKVDWLLTLIRFEFQAWHSNRSIHTYLHIVLYSLSNKRADTFINIDRKFPSARSFPCDK